MQTINCCVFRLHIANSYARRECFIIRTGHQRQSLIQNSQRSIEGHAQEDRYQPAGADFPRKIITGIKDRNNSCYAKHAKKKSNVHKILKKAAQKAKRKTESTQSLLNYRFHLGLASFFGLSKRLLTIISWLYKKH